MSKEQSETVAATAASPGEPKKKDEHVQTLEEDDEFEDFQEETWPDEENVANPNEEGKLWDEDWDEEDIEDDFANQLKQELAKAHTKK